MTVYALIRESADWDSQMSETIAIFTTRRKAEKALDYECEMYPPKRWDGSASAEYIGYDIVEYTLDDYDFD